MKKAEHLLIESNVISLRTAYVTVYGTLVLFSLAPTNRSAELSFDRRLAAPKELEQRREDRVLLYRQDVPVFEDIPLELRFASLQHQVKRMTFTTAPRLKLLWSDSGHSVALFLDRQPWAFIDEISGRGFSKGIIVENRSMGAWDQRLFEKIFSESDIQGPAAQP